MYLKRLLRVVDRDASKERYSLDAEINRRSMGTKYNDLPDTGSSMSKACVEKSG